MDVLSPHKPVIAFFDILILHTVSSALSSNWWCSHPTPASSVVFPYAFLPFPQQINTCALAVMIIEVTFDDNSGSLAGGVRISHGNALRGKGGLQKRVFTGGISARSNYLKGVRVVGEFVRRVTLLWVGN